MASLKIEERLEVAAPPGTVWQYLIDPRRVVGCLPGCALESVEDERTFVGSVTVKVGAASASYQGTIEFVEVDHDARFLRMSGKGREKRGAGSATMTMESRVAEIPTGAQVTVEADVKVSGTIVRFGRGMIEGVAKELLSEFTACLQQRLSEEPDPVEGRAGAADEVPTGPAGAAGAPSRDDGWNAPSPDPASGGDGPRMRHPPEAAPPLRLVPLIWRAFSSWMGRLLGR